jgi:hypothetical protein
MMAVAAPQEESNAPEHILYPEAVDKLNKFDDDLRESDERPSALRFIGNASYEPTRTRSAKNLTPRIYAKAIRKVS